MHKGLSPPVMLSSRLVPFNCPPAQSPVCNHVKVLVCVGRGCLMNSSVNCEQLNRHNICSLVVRGFEVDTCSHQG